MKSLRDLRIEAGLTLEAAARKLRTTAAAVSRWELGNSHPRPHMVPRIAELYGLTPEEARHTIGESARQAAEAKEVAAK